MATTTPFPFGDYVLGNKPEAVALIALYESALADSDKAGETDTAAYHEGRTEAFCDALFLLLEVPQKAWDRYNGAPSLKSQPAPEPEPEPAEVSPANDDEPPVMDRYEHVPGAAFAEADALFTRPQLRDGRGYTRLMKSGWYLYDGPRLVTLHWWGLSGEHLQERTVEHAELMRDVSNYMDRLAVEAGVDSHSYLMAASAADLILSDAQTGTSLHSWATMNRLVDQVLTEIYTAGTGVRITSQWEEF